MSIQSNGIPSYELLCSLAQSMAGAAVEYDRHAKWPNNNEHERRRLSQVQTETAVRMYDALRAIHCTAVPSEGAKP